MRQSAGSISATATFRGTAIAWLRGGGSVHDVRAAQRRRAVGGRAAARPLQSLPAEDGVDHATRRLARARVREDDLELEREIAVRGGRRRHDQRTRNLGDAVAAPLLYHCNFRWARRGRDRRGRGRPARRGRRPQRLARARAARAASASRSTSARVGARAQRPRPRCRVESNLPRMWQWIDPALGALGIEPANCSVLGRAHDRAEGRLPVLEPGESGRLGSRSRRRRGVKLGLLTAAFPDLTLDEVAAWAAANGFEALEVACWPSAGGERRRYAGVTHIDVDAFDPDEVRADARPPRPRDLVARLLPEQPPPRRRRTASRSNGHLRKVIDAAQRSASTTVGTFVGNDKDRPLPENLERFRAIWPRARRVRRRARREDRDRELPDDLQLGRVAGRQQPRLGAGDLGRDVRGDPRRELRPQPRPVAPRLAADRLRARGLRLRRPHLPRAREGPRGAPRRPLPPRHVLGRHRLAGAAAARASARSTGRASSPRCTRSATTTSSRSSTRTAASRATRSS